MEWSSALARMRAVVSRLGCSTAELVALAVLVAGSLVLLGLLWLRTPGPEPAGTATTAPEVSDEGTFVVTAEEVVVHVAGAVAAPGVYELPGGTRVADAIESAGGARADAVLDALNLAREISDGERLVVPDESALEESAAGGAGRLPDGRLDLNRASQDELEELPGIGPVTAERIVSYREAHGPFADPRDLVDVPGIGERTLETLVELVGI